MGGVLGSQKGIIIENAQRFSASGKIDKAIAEWKKLLIETPQDGNIYNNISDLYLRIDDKASAIDACLKAAGVYREAGFELKGIAVLKKILKIDPNRIDIYEILADINVSRGLTGHAIDGYHQVAKLYMKAGNLRGAIYAYKKLSPFTPDDPEVPLAIARLYQKQERFREAILSYEQAEAIYEGKNMLSDAHQIVEEIIKIDPSYLKQLIAKEASVAAVGGSTVSIERDVTLSPPKAVPTPDSLRAGTESEPVKEQESFSDDIEIFRDIIPEEMAGNSTSSSDDIWGSSFYAPSTEKEVLLADSPVSDVVLNAHLSEAAAYLKYGLNQSAIEKLLLVTQLSPTDEKAYIQLKDIYIKEGEKEKAITAGLSLCDIYEKNGESEKKEVVLCQLTEMDSTGEFRDALELRRGRAAILPMLEEVRDNPFLQAAQGAVAGLGQPAATNEKNHAEELFDLSSLTDIEIPLLVEKKEKLAPPPHSYNVVEKKKQEQYLETFYHLGIAQKEMGNFKKAIQAFEQALSGGSNRLQEMFSLLASCYAEQGDFTQAVAVLKNGLNDPRCSDGVRLAISYELASLYDQIGEKEAAFSLYKEVYQINPNFRDVSGKVKEIPFRKPVNDDGYAKEATALSMETTRLKEKPGTVIKEKRRISYV
ncbi:MAG: tetratricopeptide repeat protein [Nitrospirota bacterium]